MGPKEIDGLLVPPGKASTLLSDHLITGQPHPGKVVHFKPAIHISLIGLVGWSFLKHLFDVIILGKSPIKWRQSPDMAIAVD